ncbi:uncharacterized protein ATC70_006380 [Mucor velutinosus]|uniref:Uncharacterized protein n=1 Tax=Mucor velutinosus TaxID=708070 RepID=A0AAN7D4Y1_9FUNG|nr:hypothetical protein ATC70_006380 [Mucor velutinosus]
MGDLIPLHVKRNRSMKPATSQRCVAPWSEFLDDNKNGMKTVTELWWDIGKDNYTFRSGEDSKVQGKLPFRDADMSLCQDPMWKDYGQKHRRQARSLPTSCESLSTTSSPWRQYVRADSASKNDFSFNNSGNPWATQEYVKTGSLYILRRMNPINDFWVRPEACCEALKGMITEADLEPHAPEDDEPQTSFWSQFQASVASSSRTATLSAVLSTISEQDEDKEYINEYESNNIVVAPPQQ